MAVHLTQKQIAAAIPRVECALPRYCVLQWAAKSTPNFHLDPNFQSAFIGFYRVRRNAAWRKDFFKLFGIAHKRRYSFAKVLKELHNATGRYEASFASKLYATLNPSAPVIDSIVLKHLGKRLPYSAHKKRFQKIVGIHKEVRGELADYLATAAGRCLIRDFDAINPKSGITNVKKLDFVIWQSR